MQNQLLLTYYGDDFTGSTDSMEALAKGGLRVALFLEPPEPEQLQGRFADLQAIGVAGVSRSLSPAEMDRELRPKLAGLKRLGAPLCHYKTCSTFDSSARVGSIGRATEIGAEVFASPFVPIIVGAPALKRYMVFGNLFATVGTESYRLDRHPTMSKHPVTPMDEGDLRLHLARQTGKSMALMDLLHLTGDDDTIDRRFELLLQDKPEIIFFDILDDSHLAAAGRIIWSRSGRQPLFVVGSSGVEYALTTHWQQTKQIAEPVPFVPPGPVDRAIIVSGSASPVTAGQIEWALAHGFRGIRLDSTNLVDPDQADSERMEVIRTALRALSRGESVVVYSANGPDDPAIKATAQRLDRLGLDPSETGSLIGAQLGRILRTLLEETGLRRSCIAGGDTASYAVRQLGLYALEVAMPTAPGSPLCRASADSPAVDGLEIALKGGQVGQADYFDVVRRGKI